MDDTKKVSTNNNNGNQTQNDDFGRYDSIDDTLHMKVSQVSLNTQDLRGQKQPTEESKTMSLREK